MEISIPRLDLMVVSPEIVVLVTALLVMIVDLFLTRIQKSRLAWLSLVGVVAAAGLSYYISPASAMNSGSIPSLQDMLAADAYALALNLIILAAAALAVLFSVEYVDRKGLAQGEYYTLLLLATAGMMLMGAAINLMTIFIALEILSIALYVLVGLNRAEQRSGEAALKYLVLGAFASAFLLYGIALTYGQVGSTSLAEVREYVSTLGGEFPALLLIAMGLILVGFGFKVALVPFHMWTPDAYEGAPTSVTAFMSVGVKVAGFAALGRVLVYSFGDLYSSWRWALAILAVLTMTVGNLAALRQTNLKRMLAYSSIAHAGYILVGLAAGSQLGVRAMLFYLFVYVFMNAAAFAVIIAVGRFQASAEDGETLGDFAGLGARQPWLAAILAILMFSLAGVPPLAGFFAKLWVFSAAVEADLAWLAVIGVLNSVISAYYYLRVVAVMYFQRPSPSEETDAPVSLALQVGLGIAVIAVVVLSIWPAPILNLTRTMVVALIGG